MYKLFTDRNEDFECEVSVKNASLKNSIARLVVESIDGPTLVFKGSIQGDKCVIPVKKLRGLLDENTKGKMHLEMIVEDTYFKPWEEDFTVEEHTSIKVKVNEQKQESVKPIVEVKTVTIKNSIVGKRLERNTNKVLVSEKKDINIYIPKKEIGIICEKFSINRKNLKQKQQDFTQIIKEYFKLNPEYNRYFRVILDGIGNFLK